MPPLMSTSVVIEVDGVELAGVPLHITAFTFAIAALVIYCHRSNLKRLWNGQESKFSFKRTPKVEPKNEDSGDLEA